MILTNKQALMLFQILRESLCHREGFLHTQEFRLDLYQEIKEQQCSKLKDLEKIINDV